MYKSSHTFSNSKNSATSVGTFSFTPSVSSPTSVAILAIFSTCHVVSPSYSSGSSDCCMPDAVSVTHGFMVFPDFINLRIVDILAT